MGSIQIDRSIFIKFDSFTVCVMKHHQARVYWGYWKVVQIWRNSFWPQYEGWQIVTWRILPIFARTWNSSIYLVSWAFQRKSAIRESFSFGHSSFFLSKYSNGFWIFRILNQCQKLKLIDLSFCVHLDDAEVIKSPNSEQPHSETIFMFTNL